MGGLHATRGQGGREGSGPHVNHASDKRHLLRVPMWLSLRVSVT